MEFQPWPKIARFVRPIVITEKIDGTNAAVVISDDGKEITAQSRTRIITPQDDNFGFAGWVQKHKEELLMLGPGHHFGEWWGVGIQRGYDLYERRFSLFNVHRWGDALARPTCCHVVPVLASGFIREGATDHEGCLIEGPITTALNILRKDGSQAAPGYKNPEGIIIFHQAAQQMFKMTLENDEGKG